LGEILAQTKAKPKQSKTIYKSLGVAVEDVSAARLIWRQSLTLTNSPHL
jgi:ornithine cyclodeaminase/alanine dehydrogenase-like protein (mu-crystallin family)